MRRPPPRPAARVPSLALAVLAIALFAAGSRASAAGVDSTSTLEAFQQGIARDYPSIDHVTAAELEGLFRTPERLLLIDARGDDEAIVSRLPGAYPVEPEIGEEAFATRFATLARGRQVIIYCSVGVRSSRLATRLRERLLTAGATRVANLKGGIFALHNTRRPLEDSAGSTDWVHPYDASWARYLQRRDRASFRPRGAEPLETQSLWRRLAPF